jgi:geranylgeranyl diphosphate synthase type II
MTSTQPLPAFLEEVQDRCNRHLERLLPEQSEAPAVIHEAIRYSVFAGGKRFRPALVAASGQVFGADDDQMLDLACGIELIHTYSLIHDDLPCMDDDDLRRGRPTLHKVYGDGIAVLAGDALNALAFEVIARCGVPGIVAEVARATGTFGMIGGQVADVLFEGKQITPEDLEYIHSQKTGSLIAACLTSGARLGDASEAEIGIVNGFGSRVGLAFQIVDDILDETGDAETLGKEPGADKSRDKNTYPKIHGLQGSVDQALTLIEEAKNELVLPGRDTIILRSLADFVVHRVA